MISVITTVKKKKRQRLKWIIILHEGPRITLKILERLI